MNPGSAKKYFTASFSFDFEYTGDEVYVAYTVPYTYSQIQNHIEFLKNLDDENYYNFIKFESIGKSRGGLDIPIIKITT